MQSSHTLIDTFENRSIEYTNIYAIDGILTYLCIGNIELPHVNKFTNCVPWKPTVKTFQSIDQLNIYVAKLGVYDIYDLSVVCDNWWAHNIGHALFDSLYPIYVALVKFGYFDNRFVMLSHPIDTHLMIYDIINRFSGEKMLFLDNIDKTKPILFKKLVAGTGMTGNRVMNKTYTLYGEYEYGALTYFKRRMFNTYNLTTDKPLNTTNVRIIVVDNKRYSNVEKNTLMHAINHYKQNENINIEYIEWNKYNFAEQLKIMEDVDVYITGPGTGMMYMPFIKNGGVNINLGYMEHIQTNNARPNLRIQRLLNPDHVIPGWMEQSVCAGAHYVSTLYYDRYMHNDICIVPLNDIISKSLYMVRNGIRSLNNHNIDAQIFIEYCKRVDEPEKICEHLTNIAFFIELFVNEHPKTIQNDLVDIDLLRRIKSEYDYDTRYKIR